MSLRAEMVKERHAWSLYLETYQEIGVVGFLLGLLGDSWLENVWLERWTSTESLPGRAERQCA